MKRVKVEEAVGKTLAHDVVEYGPEKKFILFERGHQIRESEVEKLKDTGNYRVYVSENGESGVHENEAAYRIGKSSVGKNLTVLEAEKGRARITADSPGLLVADQSLVKEVNLSEDLVLAHLGNKTGAGQGEEVASAKAIPLAVEGSKILEIENTLEEEGPALEVVPPELDKIGVIVTGTEVYEGRIEDAFVPTLEEKLDYYNKELQESTILPDEKKRIENEILELAEKKFDLILVTGGMAVDSGDETPTAIEETGAEIISRGTPIFPGNMLTVAKHENTVILGLPACVLPDEKTSFDQLLPRVLAGEDLTKGDVAELGEGGLLSQS